jgi:hypothetical protein
MTGNQYSFALGNCLWDNSFGIERNGAIHAVKQAFAFWEFAMDAQLTIFNGSTECFGKRDTKVFYDSPKTLPMFIVGY